MQRIQQQEARDDRILTEFVDCLLTGGPARFEDNLHHSFQAVAVYLHEELDNFFACGFLWAIGKLIDLRDQSPELFYLFAKLDVVCHKTPFKKMGGSRSVWFLGEPSGGNPRLTPIMCLC